MTMDINNQLETALSLAERQQYEEAISLCCEVISHDDSCYKAYNSRAKIYAQMRNWAKALNDIDTVIKLKPNEPAYYFSRARWLINTENFEDAISDLTKSIQLEKELDDEYYLESAYFFRAFSYCQFGKDTQAIEDLKFVRNDFSVYLLGKVHSKQELTKACKIKAGKGSS